MSKSQLRRVVLQVDEKTDKLVNWIERQSWGRAVMNEITKRKVVEYIKLCFIRGEKSISDLLYWLDEENG